MPLLITRHFRQSRTTIYLVLGGLGLGITYLAYKLWIKQKNGHHGGSDVAAEGRESLLILYASKNGQSKKLAKRLNEEAVGYEVEAVVKNLADIEPEDLQLTRSLCLFIIPTYRDGLPPPECQWLFTTLSDSSKRQTDKVKYAHLRYCIIGLGNSTYGKDYCQAAKNLDEYLTELSAQSLLDVYFCDEDNTASHNEGLEEDFEEWSNMFWAMMFGTFKPTKKRKIQKQKIPCDGKTKVCKCKYDEHGNKLPCSSSEESDGEENNSSSSPQPSRSRLMDLEDFGVVIASNKQQALANTAQQEQPMVNSDIRADLENKGYHIIGTHSAARLNSCAESMMSGGDGCEKWRFYGIRSDSCMEMTPSIACANKCLFCLRPHSAPVSKEWKWKTDPPSDIINSTVQLHRSMISHLAVDDKITPEMLKEAQDIKHCSMSLVGEPIMYPEINKMIEYLHSKHISTSLFTNAQFPDLVRDLADVTQLYVSVDASTRQMLKRLDRPLHVDYWERFINSLAHLKNKGQRCVYRLTLIRQYNTADFEEYANLVHIGCPDFIEIQSVSVCGESKLSPMDVLDHTEVRQFSEKLCNLLPEYSIVSVHQSPNAVLLAHKKFYVDSKWHTWIDQERFLRLVARKAETGTTFTSLDYAAKTPSWSIVND